MFISNPDGLTVEEVKKTLHPYARNSGLAVDLASAGSAASEYIDESPDLLGQVGELLDEAQY